MSEEVITAKVNYFIDYWRDFLYSNSIEMDLTHTVVYNPRELFQEFADEISRKEFKNKDNKDFFAKSTDEIYNFKIESTRSLKSTLLLIKHQFGKKTNFQYLLHLLSIVDRNLSNNKLGFNCVDELEKILTDDRELNSSNKEKIKILVKLIIFELINKEYSTKSIEKIANLNLSEGLLSLKNYLSKEPEKLTYIFQIKGLKGNIDLRFGNVRIYNPQTTRLIQNYPAELNSFDELFNSEDFVYCNGAVTLKVVDYEYAKKNAALLLSKVLDVLLSGYSKYEVPIRINTTKILICDENGKQIGMSEDSDSDDLYHRKSVEIGKLSNTKYLSEYYDLVYINKLSIDNIILESLHWKRKATESFNTNDQILWYWISIENLFKDTSLIFDILPKLFAINKLYRFTCKHYQKLQDIDQLKVFGYFRQALELPEELCQKIGFRKQVEENIQLSDFINNIVDIKKAILDNCLLYDQLDFLSKVFSNSKFCIELLEEFELMAREKLFFVYRIRNKIVHNANSKNTATSNYYLSFICQASSDILFEFIKKRKNLNLKSAENIFNEIVYDFDKLKIEIKENGSEILLNGD